MNTIPLVNKQALGRSFVVTNKPPISHKHALGQMGPSIGSEELSFREAVKNLNGITKAYPKLLALVGPERSASLIQEAKASVERLQAEYLKSIPQK